MIGYAFIAPAVLGVLGLGLVPFGFVLWYSLHDWNPLVGDFTWVGGENFLRLLTDETVWASLVTTIQFAAMLMVFNVALAMALALLLNQRLPGTTTFRTFFFSPVIVSTVAWVLVWSYLVAANGGINGVLAMIGLEGPNWLRESSWALVTVVVIQVFKGVGMNMILFLAALQNVPAELKEAARIDGARPTRVFRSITLPLMTPTILLVVMVTTFGAMDVFVPIQILTQGGPGRSTTVISYLLYRTAFEQQDFGYASTIGVLIFVVALTLAALQWSTRKRWVHDEV
ncbi:sugar ABC transporter permease [Ruania suaedae]|uniref:carbohydrate ABC transporter permease n=1 Tax=Ruania suaedae TaxID=2897774 RepID=UPI001E36CFEB|nr:sugar ABC transporter permease [Ruania suaedae]UFU04550.1 sugar ABC transporter permease [Ruania suaedae]